MADGVSNDDNQRMLHERSEQALRAELEARSRPPAAGPKGLFAIPDDPALAAVDTAAIVQALRDKQRLVYGVDDRKDYYEIDSAGARANADSVAALFDAADVVDLGNGRSRLEVTTFKRAYRLCDSEAFASQPCGAFCTGFLVAPDVVASAGHCVDPKYLAHPERLRFVFGYRMIDKDTAVIEVPSAEIYSGKEIIRHRLTPSQSDWSLIRLERAVANHVVLKMRTAGTIALNAPVYVIGHPCGLPLKYAPGANVRANDPEAYFVANLDTYGGNSGSPVFNAAHEVEGILVRGGTDFVYKGACQVSVVVPTSGGRGEDVTRISEPRPFIPKP
jgi:hypothetical protein